MRAKIFLIFTFSLLLILLCAHQATHAGIRENELVILFTNDLHSSFLPDRVLTDQGHPVQQGGYARLAALIQKQQALYPDKTLLVDAGDFSMGTLFHTSFPGEASELRLMGKMGYDVVTLGNHEFDFHPDGLARMLKRARSKGQKLPILVASNIRFSQNDPADDELEQSFRSYPVREYTIIEKNGLRVGLFGILGESADHDAPFAKPVTFANQIQTSQRMVDILKNKEKVDMVICLSHSGTSSVRNHSEDETLARKVPQIDVIISAHTHTILRHPIVVGKTIIVSSGCYGAYLGVLKLSFTRENGVRLAAYDLLNVTSGIPENREIKQAIEACKEIVNRNFLSSCHLTFDQVIAESDFHLESLASAHARPGEMGLGNLITDAYRFAIKKAEGNHHEFVHFALIPLGMIRGSFRKGKITVADTFQVLSSGSGMDGMAGYPLVAFYITGRELKDILEVETSIAPLKKNDGHLQVSGVRFKYNPHRILLDRVTKVFIQNEKGNYEPLDPQKLYRACASLYTAEMIDYISGVTHGLLSITPKDKNGQAIPDIRQTIVYTDKNSAQAAELKEWIALSRYLRSFEDTNQNGLPDLPGKYKRPEGRIQPEASWNPVKLIAGGNAMTYGILLSGLALLGVCLLLAWKVVRKIRLSRRNQ